MGQLWKPPRPSRCISPRNYGPVLRQVQAVREGLPLSVVDEALAAGRLTLAELDRLALPRKTLAHRRGLGRLSQNSRIASLASYNS